MKIKIILVLLFLAHAVAAQKNKEKYSKLIDSFVAINKSDALISLLKNDLATAPQDEDLIRSLAYVYGITNKVDSAEKYTLMTLDVNPACGQCYSNLAQLNMRKNNAETALFCIEKAIQIEPQKGEFYMVKGKIRQAKGNTSAALFAFGQAIDLSPENALPYSYIAEIYFAQQKYNEALTNYNKAIKLDSTFSAAYTNRGIVLSILKEETKALSDYNKAISLNPGDTMAYMNRAVTYHGLENMDGACADFATVKKMMAKNITNRAAFEQAGEYLACYCDSANSGYYYQRGIAFYNLKEFKKAVDIYTKGLTKFPKSGLTLSFKGNAYLALGKRDSAMICYTTALQNKQNIINDIKSSLKIQDTTDKRFSDYYKGAVADIYLSMARCKLNNSLFYEALDLVNKAIETASGVKESFIGDCYGLRGDIFLSQNKYEQAIADFDKSIKANPDFSLGYLHRAIAKASLTEKVKKISYSLGGKLGSQGLNISWLAPNKTDNPTQPPANILSALEDCNTAINLDKESGFAYYIRGQLKQLLQESDYCIDLLQARKMDISVEPELLKNCPVLK